MAPGRMYRVLNGLDCTLVSQRRNADERGSIESRFRLLHRFVVKIGAVLGDDLFAV
jgi:hypothetical protein